MDKYNQRWTLWFRPNRDWTRNAITIGQTTYYSVDQSEVNPVWKKHEDTHKAQWRQHAGAEVSKEST